MTITVLKLSRSTHSAFCKVTKKVGIFLSEVAVGYLRLPEGSEIKVGDTQDIPDNTAITTRPEQWSRDDGSVMTINWLIF